MSNHFYAMVSRMRHITRWSLMRNTQTENIQEHSLQVAIIAHALAVIRMKYFSEGRIAVNPDRIATLAMFHDVSEIITGDLPTPIKYYSPEIKGAYKEIEKAANETLLGMLPDDLAGDYRGVLSPDRSDPETNESMRLVKAADRLSALIKCQQEEETGNREFAQAKKTIEDSINKITDLPELTYFIENFLPSFSLSLDQM